MQTQVQNSKAVRLGNGVLKINWTNIWMIKDASFEVDTVSAQIIGHNAKLDPRTKIKEAKLKATIMEINIDNLKTLLGWELSTVAAADNTETWNDRKVLTFDDLIHALTSFPLEFINTDENSKVWWVKLFKAYVNNGLNLSFPGDEDLENVVEFPVEFTGIADSNNKVFEIIDEQTL